MKNNLILLLEKIKEKSRNYKMNSKKRKNGMEKVIICNNKTMIERMEVDRKKKEKKFVYMCDDVYERPQSPMGKFYQYSFSTYCTAYKVVALLVDKLVIEKKKLSSFTRFISPSGKRFSYIPSRH